MSSRHASVEPVNDQIGIRDLGSTNGTFVNDVRIEAPTLLSPGHFVRIGQTVFEVIDEQVAQQQAPPQQEPPAWQPPAQEPPTHHYPPQQIPPQEPPPAQQPAGLPGAPPAQPPPALEVKDGPGGLQWVEARGRFCVVRAPARSFAAQVVQSEVQQADALTAVLLETLQIGDAGPPVDVYLVDPPVTAPGDSGPQTPPRLEGVGANGIVRVVTSEAAPAPLAGPLTFLLVSRWFGEGAASLSVVVEGLAGIAAGRIGMGPPAEETHGLVQQELEGGAAFTIIPKGDLRGAPPPSRTVSTSFVSFMMESAEPGTFPQFLSAYNPDRRDEAAMQFYEQSLGDLENEWTTSMKGMGTDFTLRSALKFLTPLIKPHSGKYLEVVLYMIFGVILTNLLPVVAGCITEGLATVGEDTPDAEGFCGVVAPQLTSGRMLLILLVLVIAYAAEAGLQLRRAYVIGGVFARIGADLQERMFAHLQRLSHRFFADARIGDLNSRLSQDLEELQGALESIYSSGAQNLMMLVLGSFTVLTQNPLVGAMVLVIIPAFVVIQRVLGPRLAMTSYEMQEISGDTSSVAQENLSAHAVVKALGMEERAVLSYRERLQLAVHSSLRLNVITQLFEGSINMTSNLARLLVIGIGGLIIIGSGSGENAGALVAILLLLPNIIDSVAQLADVGQVGQAAAGSVARANEIFDEPIDIQEKPNAMQLPPVQQGIHYENVTFGYEEDVQILKGLDLTIPKGKHVAIVGPSGSGKSTIVNLLMRFWDPQEGSVKIDGVDIRDASLASLRGQIGLVFQETFVFNLSFRENIRISKPDATDEEIEAAVRAAQLEGFVLGLPAGYETVLGERGSRMSGGQRQRLSIARALLRNPPILILDEATSALDARTEAEILEVLDEVVKNRTTITITHRLGIAADADLVVVLEDGRLVEQGPHEEIVKSGGLYQRLWEEQMGKTPVEKSSRLGLEAARLKKIPLFADLDAAALTELAQQLSPERYASGQDMVRQGDAGDKLYVISRGQAAVFVQEGAVETQVNALKDGDYFGEFALLTHQPRTATVRAVVPTEVFTLSRHNFMTLIESQPKLKAKVDKFVSDRKSAFDAAAEAAGIG